MRLVPAGSVRNGSWSDGWGTCVQSGGFPSRASTLWLPPAVPSSTMFKFAPDGSLLIDP